jgi:hypothetical protein
MRSYARNIANERGPGRLRGPSGIASRAQAMETRAHGRNVSIKFLYSTSWRFKAMRTPLTRMML